MSWQKKELGEVLASIQTGSTPSTSNPEYFNGSVSWFTPSDIGETKVLRKSSRAISSLGISEGKAKLFPEKSLLVTCIGIIGRVGILGQSSSSNQQITALNFKEDIDVNFAYYWFLLNQQAIEGLANLAVVPILNNERLRTAKFSYPSLPEQKRIAAILDKADRLRRQRRYAQTLSDSFLQSVFIKMFGDPVSNPMNWTKCQIEEVISTSDYGTSEKSNNQRKGYPILGMGNITYLGELDLGSVSYIELAPKEFEKLKLEKGDILFNRTNSTELVGKITNWNINIDAVIASYLVRLKLKKTCLPSYFVRLLNTPHYKRLFQERCKKAVGQSNVSPTLLKEFPMMLPPIPLQEKFAAIAQKFERIRRQQREATRQAEHLFQTLLHRAFRGEL